MDVADLIGSFATGTYNVTRRAAATFTAGRAVAGGTSTVVITASVQPASGRDLERLPELRRTRETRVLWTATPLLVGGVGAANEADLISIDGASYEVQLAETWDATPTSAAYCRAIVQRAA